MKIICIGRNYVEHIKELNNELPKNPIIFFKPLCTLLENTDFLYPDFTNNLHHEVELVYRISKSGKNIKTNKISDFVDKIGLGIDFTARDLQKISKEKGLPWSISKCFDGSAPISKFIDISDFDNIDDINFSLFKNQKKVQEGNSKLMIYKVDYLIDYISKFITLEEGDLIFSGTPKGVGNVIKGDKLEGFIENEKLLDINII